MFGDSWRTLRKVLSHDIERAMDGYWSRIRREEQEGMLISPSAEVRCHTAASGTSRHWCKADPRSIGDGSCLLICPTQSKQVSHRHSTAMVSVVSGNTRNKLISQPADRTVGLVCDPDKVACVPVQMRALLFVALLTAGITTAMESVEKAVATALELTGAYPNNQRTEQQPATIWARAHVHVTVTATTTCAVT